MASSVARISRQKARKREATKPAPTSKRNLRNSTPARLNKKEEIKVNFSNNNSTQLINLINLKNNKKEENSNNYLIGQSSGGIGRNFDKEKRGTHLIGEEDKLTNDNNNLFILNNNTPHFIFKPNYSAIRQRRISQMENRNRIRIVVLSITGTHRKGKSFLLNFFLDYLYKLQYTQKNQDLELEEWINDEDIVEGFTYKSGPKRCTAGIWIWAEPILIDIPSGERYAVLLMDVQGCIDQSVINGTSCTNTTNNLFTSSIQCLNSSETISEELIQMLTFFTDYGRLALTEAKELGKPFQSLAFIVRDFKLEDELIYGIEGGARFLAKVLPEAISEKRENLNPKITEVRKNIRQCFGQGVNCYLMPHPGPKVADQNSGFKGQVKEIKQLFRDEVKRLVESLVSPSVIRPKLLNGKPVTVRKFIECVKEYSRLFDSSELPEPRSILNSNLQLICVEYALDAKLAYCKAMDRTTRSARMMAEKKLLEAHIKNGIKALNIYDRCPKIYSGDIRIQNLGRLQESINHELERYQRLNEEKRVINCKGVAIGTISGGAEGVTSQNFFIFPHFRGGGFSPPQPHGFTLDKLLPNLKDSKTISYSKVTTCTSAMLACGDSPLFGLGLGGAASGAVAATVITLQMGVCWHCW
ncbi:unnamed protein product [Meloidogyne enterolobii]|uniref:Uncharacterized protein n=1 Tax=Meloidogyne enterolobii TaxID=390850 RepID=A0ACB1ALX6_MELEN